MCRLFVYVAAAPERLHDVVLAPDHAILRQSYAARHTPDLPDNWRDHVVNADGYGIGWAHEDRYVLYRSSTPPWNDCNLSDIAETHASRLVFAHVRAIKPFSSSIVHQLNCHPFRHENFMWMHNGEIQEHCALRALVCRRVDEDICRSLLHGTTDSELCFALFVQLHRETGSVRRAMRDTIRAIIQLNARPCSLNFAVTDRDCVCCTRFIASDAEEPPSLYYRARDTDVILSSEPMALGESSEWHVVPKNHAIWVNVRDRTFDVEPLAA